MLPLNTYFITYYDGDRYVVVKREAVSFAEAFAELHPVPYEDITSAIEMRETGLNSDLESMFEFTAWADEQETKL